MNLFDGKWNSVGADGDGWAGADVGDMDGRLLIGNSGITSGSSLGTRKSCAMPHLCAV